MRPLLFKMMLVVAGLFAANETTAQKAVGDTLRFTVIAGGSVTVPEGELWQFVGLSYSNGAYSMHTTWNGPDTLEGKHTWVAPMWNVEAQLLGDGKTDGFYNLTVTILRGKSTNNQ